MSGRSGCQITENKTRHKTSDRQNNESSKRQSPLIVARPTVWRYGTEPLAQYRVEFCDDFCQVPESFESYVPPDTILKHESAGYNECGAGIDTKALSRKCKMRHSLIRQLKNAIVDGILRGCKPGPECCQCSSSHSHGKVASILTSYHSSAAVYEQGDLLDEIEHRGSACGAG
jgi:hypothetical protein